MKSLLSIPLLGLFLLVFGLSISAQNIIHIPEDYPNIQVGIDQANVGDTLIVAPGIYDEVLNFKGKDLVVASRYLLESDTSIIHETVIDANFEGPAVVFENEESTNAVLMGFTIKSGSQDSIREYGGGIVCKGSSPQILHNFIKENYSVTGLYGGGIVCSNSQAIIRNNVLDSNAASFFDYSGAIVAHNSQLEISGNTINNMFGGYVFKAGGGIVCIQSDVNIHHNLITENYYFDNINGGILLDTTRAEIVNNTIFGNNHGVTFLDSNSVSLINNIMWSSRGFNINDVDSSSRITCIYNDLENGYPGAGNIADYPEFVDTLAGNFKLKSTSPCIDAGHVFWVADPDGTRVDMGAFYFDQSSTSVQDIGTAHELTIYPTPAKFKINIDLSQYSEGGLSLRILNMNGSSYWFQEKVTNSHVGIDCQNFPNGLYIIQLFQNGRLIALGKALVYS